MNLLRKQIEDTAGKEPYMGEQIPIKWLWFEREVANLVQEDHNHATFDQVCIYTIFLFLKNWFYFPHCKGV